MNSKYLPIGTVVNINGVVKKIMIIGYYSIEYQNSVKIFDYVGCAYPEGLLVKNNMYSFNHSDITNIEFTGYTDSTYNVLNNILTVQQNGETEELAPDKPFVNLKFDENGVVVYEELSNTKVAPQVVPKTFENPFAMPTPVEDSSKAPKIDKKYKFDENGTVIGETSLDANIQDIESNFKFKFDENGVVIEEASNNIDDQPKVSYKFDANGTVIGESNGNETNEPTVPNYKFSEDGIVIGE